MHTTLPDVIGRECRSDLQEAYLNDKPLESMEIVNKVIDVNILSNITDPKFGTLL